MAAVRGLIGWCVVLALATPAWAQQASLRWESNLDAALKTAASTNKLVLVHFWAPWCRPCQKLETSVFKQPGFGAQLDSQFIAVKLDLDQNHALAQKWGVTAIPTDVVVTPQGQVVFKTHSPQTAELYVSTMQQIATKSRGPAATLASKPASAVPSVSIGGRNAVVGGTPPASIPATSPAPPATPATASPAIPATPAPAAPAPTTTSAVAPSVNGASSQVAATDGGRYDYYYNRGDATKNDGLTAAVGGPVSTAPAIPPATAPIGPQVGETAAVGGTPAPAATTPAAVAQPPVVQPALSDNRYADHRYSDDRYATPAPVATTATPPANVAVATPVTATIDSRVAAQSAIGSPVVGGNVGQPPLAPPTVAPTAPPVSNAVVVAPPRSGITQDQLPPGSPALALDGYCPTTVVESRKWELGDIRFGAIHRGRTYLFTNEVEQRKFLANPDRFSPIMSGNDPVLEMNQGQSVAGNREYGVFYNDRMVLFSSKESLTEFSKNPTRYAAEVTAAMR